MNILLDPWLPVQRSGQRTLIRVAELACDDLVDLAIDLPEQEFGAIEMLIGILAMCMAPRNFRQFEAGFSNPPTPEELQARLMAYAPGFNLLGGGPRFMQYALPAKNLAEREPISRLLMGAAGEETERKNLDTTVHRDHASAMSPAEAALALYTHQVRLQGVGAGHKSSARGGAHQTILVDPRSQSPAPPLWALVWGNVPILEDGPLDPAHLAHALPWMRKPTGADLGPAERHSLRPDIEVFFAASRRFWLHDEDGRITSFSKMAKGYTYDGWQHPLSPYSKTSQGRISYAPDMMAGSVLDLSLKAAGVVRKGSGTASVPALQHHLRMRANQAPRLLVATQANDNADFTQFSVTRDCPTSVDPAHIEHLEACLDVTREALIALGSAFAGLAKAPNSIHGVMPFSTYKYLVLDKADTQLAALMREPGAMSAPDFDKQWFRFIARMIESAFRHAFLPALVDGAEPRKDKINGHIAKLRKRGFLSR